MMCSLSISDQSLREITGHITHSLMQRGNESIPQLYTSGVRAVVSDSVETPSRELSIIRIIKTIDDPRYHCATRIIIAVRDDRSASYQTLELSPTFVLLSYTRTIEQKR